MFNNKQVLILTVLVLLVASLSFNMGITGDVVKEVKTTIDINPKVITAGDQITINIEPGERGMSRYITFYRLGKNVESSLRKAKSGKVCVLGYRCYESITLEYPTSTNWPEGTYYAEIYDYASLNYVKEYFVVEKFSDNYHFN